MKALPSQEIHRFSEVTCVTLKTSSFQSREACPRDAKALSVGASSQFPTTPAAWMIGTCGSIGIHNVLGLQG